MIWLLTAWLLLSAGIGLAWRREMRRLERERRRKALLASAPFARYRRDLVALQITIRDSFTPAMRQVAESLAPLARRLREAELRRVNEYRKGGTR